MGLPIRPLWLASGGRFARLTAQPLGSSRRGMILALHPRFVVALLGLFAFLPASLNAGMTPEEVRIAAKIKENAERGVARSQCVLGFCYSKGQGVAKDEVEAVRWYRKAAEQGYAPAQYYLGHCYTNGEGVAKDEVEAYAYWNLSGITLEPARRKLAILENKMSSDARLLGQQRAKFLQKEIEEKKAGK